MAAGKEEEGRPRKTLPLVPRERLLKEDGARFEDGARVLQEARNCLRTWINADEFRATVGKRINYQQAYQILEDEELMRCNDLPGEDKHRCAVFHSLTWSRPNQRTIMISAGGHLTANPNLLLSFMGCQVREYPGW